MFATAEVPIGPEDTLSSLRSTLVDEGTRLLVHALDEGLGEPEPQVGEVVYAEKLTSEDLHLDWSRPAAELDRVVRVGGAWTTFRGKRLKVHAARPDPDAAPGLPGTLEGVRVATGQGVLELVEVQPEGKGRQPADVFLRGFPLAAGTVLA